jgi:hypothetical protein
MLAGGEQYHFLVRHSAFDFSAHDHPKLDIGATRCGMFLQAEAMVGTSNPRA